MIATTTRIQVILCIVFFGLTACSQTGGKAGSSNNHKQDKAMTYTDGKDYLLLKRFRVIDPSGFAQPVEAASFLLPANWHMEGGVTWNTSRCLSDIVQFSAHALSPDKKYELFVFPTTQFDWVNNQQMMYALRTGGYGSGCTIAEPVDAATYIQQQLPGLVNATAISATAITSIEQQLKQQAAQYSAPGYSIVPSVAEGKLQFADGSEGIALCSISQIIQSMQGYDGSAIAHYQTAVNNRVVLKYPKGEAANARNLLGTIQSSVRVNTVWINAIQTMFNNIRKMVQDETWKRIQISQQAQEEISNNIARSWEKRNENPDKSSEWFGQYIRGVETWTDEGGNKVELTSGYSNAWSKSDGTYLLTINPAFDPNVEMGDTENWKRLNK
ncbi:MAG: hypothetical protein U0V75_10025 [Ferruginibacter sp.]